VTLSRQTMLVALALLVLLRFVAAAVLPLSADEAYYWLWSRHLQAGYYDHPPAIAFIIRAGTFVFGDTAFAVRIGCVLLSLVASWFTYAAARILLDREERALGAALIFNLTMMVAVEAMVATPDAPVLAAAAAFVFALAKIAHGGSARWWLFAGIAAGLGLLSKYTMLFLGAGAFLWLCLAPLQRHWLGKIWPYAGAVIAFAIFAPNLVWNAQNDWMTFAFQFGRAAAHHFNPGFIFEFIGAQLALATPLILLAAILGLGSLIRDRRQGLFLLPMLAAPSFLYFLWHGLHDRVQGNWPSFLYPIFAIACLAAFAHGFTGWRAKLAAVCRHGAVPLAAFLLALIYAQSLFTLIPFGRKDPVARLLAYNMDEVIRDLQTLAARNNARGILTSDYATTAWLKFYAPDMMVVPLGEPGRWRFAPSTPLSRETLLYMTETRRDAHETLLSQFSQVKKISQLVRKRKDVPITHYTLYRVRGPKAELFLPRP